MHKSFQKRFYNVNCTLRINQSIFYVCGMTILREREREREREMSAMFVHEYNSEYKRVYNGLHALQLLKITHQNVLMIHETYLICKCTYACTIAIFLIQESRI